VPPMTSASDCDSFVFRPGLDQLLTNLASLVRGGNLANPADRALLPFRRANVVVLGNEGLGHADEALKIAGHLRVADGYCWRIQRLAVQRKVRVVVVEESSYIH
jgi:hypothetical protein